MYPKIRFTEIIAGSLGQVKQAEGIFWRLTWKVDGKTKCRYVRLDELDRIRKGVKAYQEAKEILKKVAESNLTQVFGGRKNDS